MKSFLKMLCVLIVMALSLGSMPLTALAQDNYVGVDKNLMKLPVDIDLSDYYLIVSEEENCFYAVGEEELYKYDFSNNEYEKVESYTYNKYGGDNWRKYVNDIFIKERKIYLGLSTNCYSPETPCYNEILCYDLDTHQMELVLQIHGDIITAIGVDDYGRIYVGGRPVGIGMDGPEYIRVYDSEKNILDEIVINERIHSFVCFDEKNGLFFTNSEYNWVYWGYDHWMNALKVGTIDKDNKIEYNPNVVMMVSQRFFLDRLKQFEMLGDKYIALDSTFHKSYYLFEMDDFLSETGEIKTVLDVSRIRESGEFDADAAYGTRSVYLEDTDSLVYVSEDNIVNEKKLGTGECVGSFTTRYNVYAMLEYNGDVLLLEKDGDSYYYCIIEAKKPAKITASPDELTLHVGESITVDVSVDGVYMPELEYKSSNPRVATTTEDGTILAWGEGTATIKVSANNLTSAVIKVNVLENFHVNSSSQILTGKLKNRGDNAGDNTYSNYSQTVKSYIAENDDGSFTLVNARDNKVYVDTYSSDFSKCIKTIEIKYPLSIFGGFYDGDEYNFLIFGEKNEQEKDKNEVIRIQKYSKNWKLLDSLSVYGENTSIPFDAGSLRMTETQDLLYVHTCHEMYKSSDGNNHQANLSFAVDKKNMELQDIFSGVLNIAQAGYVSHSFDQYVINDDENIYRVDLGDGYPRGITITKIPIGGEITDVECAIAVKFYGDYTKIQTGASIGGVEVSDNNILIAGNMTANEESLGWFVRDIFVNVTDKDLNSKKTVYITDYDVDGDITGYNPHLIKFGNNRFLVVWEEYDRESYEYITKMVTIDSNGIITSNVVGVPKRLSDCKPIFASDNTVKWFAMDGDKSVLCSVNPYNLDKIAESNAQTVTVSNGKKELLGDVNLDGNITVKDATLLQKHIAKITKLNKDNLMVADVKYDGRYTVTDATLIQKYVAKIISVF